MKCNLMHKNIPVMSLEFDEVTGSITQINDIYEPSHLPVGLSLTNGSVERRELNRWWLSRAIPASRSGLKEALEKLNIASTAELLGKSYGLNLSDQYWMCPQEQNIDWHDINFFENAFSEDIGNIMIGNHPVNNVDYMSPDSASDGWLKKKWKITDGKRVLLKAGSNPFQQEPLNEVLATSIMSRLGIPCTKYTLTAISGNPYSVCEDFITPDTELVTAHNILRSRKQSNHISKLEHYINCCSELGIKDIRRSVDQMMTLDYLIVNEDRHLNNFGLIRNADTLEYKCVAPIYDSGTSMWFRIPTAMIKAGARDAICKPFKEKHSDQIKLVSSFEWLDISKLKGIDEEYHEILKKSAYIDEDRRDSLCSMLTARIEMLKTVVENCLRHHNVIITGNDVAEDIAYSGEENMTM